MTLIPTRARSARVYAVALAAAANSLVLGACADSATAPVAPATVEIATPSLATSANISWWDNLSASQRGQIIENEAERWVGASSSQLSNTYRCNCKEFARYVVQRASRGVVYLPPTVDRYGNLDWRGYQLRSSSHTVKVTDHLSGSIGRAMPGDVVQANHSSGPHTMIISAVTADNVYVVDANVGGCGIRARGMSRSRFASGYIRWTLYRMI